MLAGCKMQLELLVVFLLLAPAPRRSGAELLETQGVTVSVEDERGRNDRLDINSEGFVVDADREVGPRSWPWTVSIGYWDPLSADATWVHRCSGSIVTDSRVVTSATCIDVLSDPYYYGDGDGGETVQVWVRAGDLHLEVRIKVGQCDVVNIFITYHI